MRIRNNYIQEADFEMQSEMLSKMFRDKGYRDDFLEKEKKIWIEKIC